MRFLPAALLLALEPSAAWLSAARPASASGHLQARNLSPRPVSIAAVASAADSFFGKGSSPEARALNGRVREFHARKRKGALENFDQRTDKAAAGLQEREASALDKLRMSAKPESSSLRTCKPIPHLLEELHHVVEAGTTPSIMLIVATVISLTLSNIPATSAAGSRSGTSTSGRPLVATR
jgi:hypothetical protein